jgi:hypothetical protein
MKRGRVREGPRRWERHSLRSRSPAPHTGLSPEERRLLPAIRFLVGAKLAHLNSGDLRRRVIDRSFGRGTAGVRVLQARSPCAATPRHGSGRRSAPSGGDDRVAIDKRVARPRLLATPSVKPRCQAAYSSQECVLRNAFCSRARGCTSCQRERSTNWRASISRFACRTASSFTVYAGTRAFSPTQPARTVAHSSIPTR